MFVYNTVPCVRPVLTLENIDSTSFEIGDTFEFRGYIFTIISKEYALCDEGITTMAYRSEEGVENANDYESSDIKAYLEKWFNCELTANDCISGITLLSVDEAENLLTKEQRKCTYNDKTCGWWLRSPGTG